MKQSSRLRQLAGSAIIADTGRKASVMIQILTERAADISGTRKHLADMRVDKAEWMKVPFGNFTPFRIPDDCELEPL